MEKLPLPELINAKCTVCGRPAVAFASPLDNPDEPALCQKHWGAYCDGILKVTKRKTLDQLTEEHTVWTSGFFAWVYREAFKHGYGHGKEDGART